MVSLEKGVQVRNMEELETEDPEFVVDSFIWHTLLSAISLTQFSTVTFSFLNRTDKMSGPLMSGLHFKKNIYFVSISQSLIILITQVRGLEVPERREQNACILCFPPLQEELTLVSEERQQQRHGAKVKLVKWEKPQVYVAKDRVLTLGKCQKFCDFCGHQWKPSIQLSSAFYLFIPVQSEGVI